MNAVLPEELFLVRAREYVRATGVKLRSVARHSGFGALGLPDLRGFTPHLRTVRLFANEGSALARVFGPGVEHASDETPTSIAQLTIPELWLLHDLLHIIWYDVATVTFGIEGWAQRDFFLEQHLVSEALAVLLLDYHVLAFTPHHGLAVEVSQPEWAALRRRSRELPELRSFELCRELVTQYLTGTSPLFRATADPTNARVAAWRDHEVSYSDKQRWYVFLWWDDLNGRPLANQQAVVEGSPLAELLYATLQLFTVDSDAAFRIHVERVARRLAGVDNLFAGLPKYQVERAAHDFRFTDATALPSDRIAAVVASATAPRASELFLFWQLLALTTPDRMSAAERAAVATLAASAQTPAVDPAAWSAVRVMCERLLTTASWVAEPSGRAAFFLP